MEIEKTEKKQALVVFEHSGFHRDRKKFEMKVKKNGKKSNLEL